jgi:protoporphyrinogen IX oxidase
MLWLKVLHIAGLTIWVAGLLYLPSMLIGHHKIKDQQDFARVRMASRFAYMGMVSPAAFVTVGAGSALLFVADALHPWMFAKLVAVGVLVIAHVQYGYVLTHLADQAQRAPELRVKLIAAAVLLSSLIIILLVLAKPDIPIGFLPTWLLEPGLLSRPEVPPPVPHPPLPQS